MLSSSFPFTLYLSIFLSFVYIPNTSSETLSHLEWRQSIIDEMCALSSSSTWELVYLSIRKSLVGYRWLYIVEVSLDGKIDQFKPRLIAKGYNRIFMLDYSDTFLHVVKMTSFRLVLAIAAI